MSLYSMKEVFSSLRDDGEMEGTKMIPLKVVDMSQSIRVYPNLLQSQISLKMMLFYTSSVGNWDHPQVQTIPNNCVYSGTDMHVLPSQKYMRVLKMCK